MEGHGHGMDVETPHGVVPRRRTYLRGIEHGIGGKFEPIASWRGFGEIRAREPTGGGEGLARGTISALARHSGERNLGTGGGGGKERKSVALSKVAAAAADAAVVVRPALLWMPPSAAAGSAVLVRPAARLWVVLFSFDCSVFCFISWLMCLRKILRTIRCNAGWWVAFLVAGSRSTYSSNISRMCCVWYMCLTTVTSLCLEM